jgi:quercetin dioxygenase-like cupin family protein
MRVWNLFAPSKSERTGPRVLFSTPEARVVLIELAPQQEMGEHRVRERAIVQVVRGSVDFSTEDGTNTCDAGTLVLLEPSEHHVVRAREPTQLLLTLAPWPAPGHYPAEGKRDPHELPAHATGQEGL